MQKSMLNKLCCPMDKSELTIEIYREDETGEVLEGMMTCPGCKRYYPIIYSIPIMSPDEYRQKGLEAPMLKKWGLELLNEDPKKFQLAQNSNHLLQE